jgi:hypothetical protein
MLTQIILPLSERAEVEGRSSVKSSAYTDRPQPSFVEVETPLLNSDKGGHTDTKTGGKSNTPAKSDNNNKNNRTGYPCGGGVEYLHRDPASRKRRRNGTKKGRAIA